MLDGRARRLVGRTAGFGGSVLINGVVSVAVIPVVIAAAGAHLWSGVAIAQAIGSFMGVVITFGWAVTGPAAVAALPPTRRGPYFADSLASRSWLAMGAAPVILGLVLLAAPGDSAADLLAAAALALPALGASWFFVGERDPRRLLLLDTVPRATGTAVGAAALLVLHAPLVVFSAGQVSGATAAVALSATTILRRSGARFHPHLLGDLRRLRSQSHGVVAAVVAAVYVNLPVVLAGIVVPQQAALYALADKLQKLALTALGPVFQITQGAVGAIDESSRATRARLVARLGLAVGLVVALVFPVGSAVGAAVLTGGRLAPPLLLLIALGIALGAITTSAITGLSCLTALGAVRAVAVSTVLGAVIGIPAILVAGATWGLVGIGAAAALSEVAVTAYQLAVLHRRTAEALRPRATTPLLGSPTF